MNCPSHRLAVSQYKTIFHFAYLLMPFFGLIFSSAFAQSNDLEKSLTGMPDDTAKVNLLLQLGAQYCSLENDKALMFLQEALTLATQENYEAGIGKSLLWQGRVYYYKDEYPLAFKYLERAKPYFETTNDKENLAFLYFVEGEIHRIRGDYANALQVYSNALELAEEINSAIYKSTYYSSLGRVHIDRKEPEIAMGYFKDALREKIEIDDQAGISNTYTCIGMAFELLNNLDSALYYHEASLKIRTSLQNTRAIAGSEYNKGGILIKLKRYNDAEKSLKIATENFSGLDEKTGVIICNLRMAEALNFQSKSGAIELAENTLEMAKSIDNPSLISHAYKVLSEIYSYNKQFNLAFDYLEKHKRIDDSIFNTEKERILTEFEEKFQSERKDREIKEYQSKSRIQRQNIVLLVSLLVGSLGILILLFYFFRLKSTTVKRQQTLLEQEQLIHAQQNTLAEKENQLLQEQLESKNRELAAKALEMIRLNDTISQIIEKLDLFKSKYDNPELSMHIKEIVNDLENQTKQNIWNEFDKIFKNIHSDFYSKLLEICPDLTATEIKTAALLRLNLTTKEIAALTFKSEGGIKTTRYRIRKKLDLSSDDKLIPYLIQI